MRPLVPEQSALLVIDVQHYVLDHAKHPPRPWFYERARATVLPNLMGLLAAARQRRLEVVYTVMENGTRDGRDRSLDYKLSGFFIVKGSHDAKVLPEIGPGEDELVLPKTSSSLFNSTNFDYLMRNMGIHAILCAGFLTDQCVDQTMRDGASRGYEMVCVTDACAANTQQRHERALAAFAGFGAQVTTDQALRLIAGEG
jgi:nicotinamidase-related amidase